MLFWISVTADKGSIGAQATFGIRKDTHLVGQQFACKLYSETSFVVMGWADQTLNQGSQQYSTLRICLYVRS